MTIMALATGCAKEMGVLAQDTQPGEQLKSEYLIGQWCTNRELTAQYNYEAGLSSLINLDPQFWRFRESGKWENSDSGWIFAYYGDWELVDRDQFQLKTSRDSEPTSYQASFKNDGVDLFLKDDEGQFLVLSRCE